MVSLFSRTNTFGFLGFALRAAVTFTATMGFSLFGYDQGLMSGIITGVKFNEEFPPTAGTDHHATVIQGAVTSCYELGCFFGAVFVLLRGDKIGRKPLVIVGSSIIILGTIISVAAFKDHWGMGQFVIGRVITGVGNGMNTATIPVWQSEMSKAHNRGRLVNLEGSVVAVGTFIAYWLDFGLSYVNSSVQWRFPIAFQIFFAAIVFICMSQLPESPRWLIANHRKEDAKLVLSALKGVSSDDPEIESEVGVIADAVHLYAKQQVHIKEMFTGGKSQHFARMLIGASTQFFQQFTGCNAAIYYSTVLFETTIGMERRLAMIMGGVFATVYALFTLPSFFLVDTLGRRKLFLIGAVGQGVAFIITFACLVNKTKDTANGAAVGIFLFIAFFAFTILPLPWVYPPEINPLRTRTVGTGVSTCTNWICNFAVVMFTPIFMNTSDWGCYLFFACMNFLWVPVIIFFYPETAGRTLEEVDVIFAKAFVDGTQPWRVAATLPKLTNDQVEEYAVQLGFYDEDDGDMPVQSAKTTDEEKEVDTSSGSKKEESV